MALAKIMIVDDSRTSRRVLKDMLESRKSTTNTSVEFGIVLMMRIIRV